MLFLFCPSPNITDLFFLKSVFLCCVCLRLAEWGDIVCVQMQVTLLNHSQYVHILHTQAVMQSD